jgi:Mor family transcriptional regulator
VTREEVEIVDVTGLYTWLLQRVRWEEFVEMCQRFGGQRVWIPKQPYIEDRNAEIRRQFGSIVEGGYQVDIGSVYNHLSKEFGLSVRNIRRVLYE